MDNEIKNRFALKLNEAVSSQCQTKIVPSRPKDHSTRTHKHTHVRTCIRAHTHTQIQSYSRNLYIDYICTQIQVQPNDMAIYFSSPFRLPVRLNFEKNK